MKKSTVFFMVIGIFLIILVFFMNLGNFSKKNPEKEKENSKNNLTEVKEQKKPNNEKEILEKKDKYKEIGINPEKYNSFKDFLEDFKTFTGINIDPVNENFVIGKEFEDGSISYTSIRYKDQKDIYQEKNKKNDSIIKIYKAYKDNMIFDGSEILFPEDRKHSFSDVLGKVIEGNKNPYNYIKELEKEKIKNMGLEQGEFLGYLYDFVGNYSSGNSVREKLCKTHSNCSNKIKINIYGKIYNSKGKPIEGAKIKLLNNGKEVLSSNNGNYKLEIKMIPFSHLRLKVSKKGYSNGFIPYSLNDINNGPKEKRIEFDFTLHKAEGVVNITKENLSEHKEGNYLVAKNLGDKYFIPIDGLHFKNGKKIKNIENLKIYFYNFSREDDMSSYLRNDALNQEIGFLGNQMITFGMPYMQIFDGKTGKELFTYSTNPMILQTQSTHYEKLFEKRNIEKDKGLKHKKITKTDINKLLKYSQEEGGYPITYKYLKNNNLLNYVPWWSLDREKGIWFNSPFRLIDKKGKVEIKKFHIKK